MEISSAKCRNGDLMRYLDVEAAKALKVIDKSLEADFHAAPTDPTRNEIAGYLKIFERLLYIPEGGYDLVKSRSDLIAYYASEINCIDILDRYNNKNHVLLDYRKISKGEIADHKVDDRSNEAIEIKYENATIKLVKHYNLQISTVGDGKAIYWFDGQIYRMNGKAIVSNILYKIMNDDIESKDIREIINRIRAMLCTKPIEFDKNPFLLGVMNGIIDLKKGAFRDYNSDDFITDQIPVIYDPVAKCPKIFEFIESLTPDEGDRETLLDLIASGAIRSPLPIIANILGGGSSGSSEYFKLIDKIYGQHNSVGLSLNDIGDDGFSESELINKRFCLAREVEDDKGHVYSSSKLKKWTGGDKSSLRIKYKGRIESSIFAKPILAGNTMPRFNHRTYAFTRRLVCIKFPYRFVDNPTQGTNEQKKIVGIVDRICTPEELSGFLNVIIERAKYIIEHNQIHKKKIDFDEIDQTTDSAESFLNRFCEYDPQSSVFQFSKDLYAKYEAWVKALVLNKANSKAFGVQIKNFCNEMKGQKTSRIGKGGKKESVEKYVGLSFIEAEYLEEMKTKTANTASVPPDTADLTANA